MDLRIVKAFNSVRNKCQAIDSDVVEYAEPIQMATHMDMPTVRATIAKSNDQILNLKLNINQHIYSDRVLLYLYSVTNTGHNAKISVELSNEKKYIKVRFLNDEFKLDTITFAPTIFNIKSDQKIRDLLIHCGLENNLDHPLVKIIHKLMLEQHLRNISLFEQNFTCSIQDFKGIV